MIMSRCVLKLGFSASTGMVMLVWCAGASATQAPAGDAVAVVSLATRKEAGMQQTLSVDPADVASKEAIVAALYDVISGPAGKKRNWNRMRSLFIPGGRLIATGKWPAGEIVYRVMDVEGYISTSGDFVETNGFFEREIARRTDSFGNIAHVFSTYEARHRADDPKPFMRGINSIQLLNDGTRWWVVTVSWQPETPDTPVPERYLKKEED